MLHVDSLSHHTLLEGHLPAGPANHHKLKLGHYRILGSLWMCT